MSKLSFTKIKVHYSIRPNTKQTCEMKLNAKSRQVESLVWKNVHIIAQAGKFECTFY